MAEQSRDDLVKALEALSAAEPRALPESSPGEPAQSVPPPSGPSTQLPRQAASANVPPRTRSLELKRTMIPLLLTLGIALPALGIACLMMGDESPLADQALVPLLMIVVGVLIAAAGVVTMIQVRAELSAKAVS